MNHHTTLRNPAIAMLLLLVPWLNASGQQAHAPDRSGNALSTSTQSAGRLTFSRAFVVDDRLSALRREPGLQSEVIHRLRLGRPVYIITFSKPKAEARFCRVAVTRRTRGWILESALAAPGKTGEDRRIMKLIEGTKDGVDRISLCRLLIERFGQSPLVPRALLLMGEEADRAAQALTQRARKRLADASEENWNAKARDYFLNDVGLDRYSKLHVVFDFNEVTSEYVYDGRAYVEVVRRFPSHEEAGLARQRIEADKQKMAKRRQD
jgi:hypothetical protein